MRTFAEIANTIETARGAPAECARAFLAAGEDILEHWVIAHGKSPTQAKAEGFRLLALHRQGAKGDPSFNACRETCRELVYHYNVVMEGGDAAAARALMMRFVLNHLYLFIGGKMENEGLGEFCCSSRALRTA